MSKHTLFELNEYLKRVIAINLPDALWLSAELSEVSKSRGHLYIALIEKDEHNQQVIAQAQAVMWAGVYYQLKRKIGKDLDKLLQVGMQVLLKVKVDYNERYGLKLLIQSVDPAFTLGQMELKRREIIQQLANKKLVHKNKKLILPLVLQRIAVISSPKAAGLQDFLKHIAQSPYQVDCTIFKAAMQGQFVEKEGIRALKTIMQQATDFDAIVITRGGGSKLDLSGFDSFKLCAAVANCTLPVLVGIGHEVDETILDLVAHTSLKTPTAVADFIVATFENIDAQLDDIQQTIQLLVADQLQQKRHFLAQREQQLFFQIHQQLQQHKNELSYIEQTLPRLLLQQFKTEKTRLQLLEKTCTLLSPQYALNRGFSLTLANGKVVTKATAVTAGTKLTTYLKHGIVNSTVQKPTNHDLRKSDTSLTAIGE